MMKIVSLFSGCGGLDLGFEKAGFKVIWANEYDKSIHATYRFNHPHTILNIKDIRLVESKDIPDCDGIIGGPPCQSWSEGGKQRGIEDPRGKLFLEFIRIVADKKPKFFVIENVKGILEEKHKLALDMFLEKLDKAGYSVSYELLNAADYKIPQDRFRVFFVGIRRDIKKKYIFPDGLPYSSVSLRQAIGDICENPNFVGDEPCVASNSKLKNHDVYTGAYDIKYMSRNRVRSWDDTSFTIQAQARNIPIHPQAPKMQYISTDRYIFMPNYENLYRRLSVRECARIQTFPDNFVFLYNRVVDGYKMVGNAVPPRLAWYIACQLKSIFIEEFNVSTHKINYLENNCKKGVKLERIETVKDILGNTTKSTTSNFEKNHDSATVLIGLVKSNYSTHFSESKGKIYYTGKYFPSSIILDKLCYFMPYIKGKGIKDLYRIRNIRIGSKYEINPTGDKEDIRLFFEIEYVKELFREFQPIHLNYLRTYTETKLEQILKINDGGTFEN